MFRLARPVPPALPRRWVRELDRRAIEELGIPGLLLMENAGRGAAEMAMEACPEGPVVVVCGKGNNGGDGLVIARLLHARGAPVRALLMTEALTGDAARNLAAARACGVPIALADAAVTLGAPALVVDALLGTGLSGPVRPPYDAAIRAVNAAGCPRLAIDIPSGLCADTGAVLGVAVRADATATFAAPKPGFARGEGPAHVGRVEVLDISLPPSLVTEVVAEARAAGDLA